MNHIKYKNTRSRSIFKDKSIPFLVSIITVAIVPLLLANFKEAGNLKYLANSKEIFILVGITLTLLISILMVRFLSGNSNYTRESVSRDELEYLKKEFKKQIERTQTADSISTNDEKCLINEVFDRIKSEATEEYIEELKNTIKESEYKYDIFKRREATLERVYREIDSLGRRGTINLVLGVITALLGIVVLSFFVLNNVSRHSTLSDFAMDFLPRLSIVLIIEVFSYFFLRLYKSSLTEIKYFQNEATNIEHNFVALESSIAIGDKQLIEKCIYTFLAIERNPLMTEGQTTREIIADNQSINSTSVSPEYLIKLIEALSQEEKPKSGKSGFLSRSPHTTPHAAPQGAVH